MTDPGQSAARYGSVPVALLSAQEAIAIYDALGEVYDEHPPAHWNDRQKAVYTEARYRLYLAAKAASA